MAMRDCRSPNICGYVHPKHSEDGEDGNSRHGVTDCVYDLHILRFHLKPCAW